MMAEPTVVKKDQVIGQAKSGSGKSEPVESYAYLIPDEDQVELINWKESSLERSFWLGKKANDLAEKWKKGNIKKAFVYRAVSSFAGPPERTIREYADIEEFFRDVWKSYEILSFSHFRFAYKRRRKNWKEILDWSIQTVDDKGRPATLSAVEEKFIEEKEKGDENEKIINRLGKWYEDAGQLVDEETNLKILDLVNEIRDVFCKSVGKEYDL